MAWEADVFIFILRLISLKFLAFLRLKIQCLGHRFLKSKMYRKEFSKGSKNICHFARPRVNRSASLAFANIVIPMFTLSVKYWFKSHPKGHDYYIHFKNKNLAFVKALKNSTNKTCFKIIKIYSLD